MLARHWLLIAALLLPPGLARAADPPMTQDQAMALLHDGKRQEALHALDAIIAANPPDPTQALFAASQIDLQDGDWRSAKPFVKRLIKLRPASFQIWEMMVQVDQAAGDTEDCDLDIQSLHAAWQSATDPQIRSQIAFVRDHVTGPKHTLVAQQTFETGGDDSLRFLFQPLDEAGQARHLIVVQSDSATNERWRENGTIPYGTVVYHLDTTEQRADGQSVVRPYKYFLEPPGYDQVRAMVVAILAGTIKPLTGDPDPFWAGEPAK
ncbi:M48 family metallopeptidase [Acidisphaera sp. S103]|uniref:tetratricopeptide repeat protein n=1 Tax=Acidisphaera sp. S103 TaxID=1747223 RepID=UPI00131E3D65|nr:tetratricopeptide repeat protein [Acidisphaera sp. S103]